MKQIFYIAGGLLGVSGLLHLLGLTALGTGFNTGASALVLALFGATFLVIGTLLLRRTDAAVTPGLLAPLLSLLAVILNIIPILSVFAATIIVIDVLVIAICAYLFITGRAALGRVR